MTGIPKDAREVYYNEAGEPIAFCPVDSIGLTDLARASFYSLNEGRLLELAERASQKQLDPANPPGTRFAVVCIDVDDPRWTWMAEFLMPDHDWQPYRDRGEQPVARGVVPLEFLQSVVDELYPAAGKMHDTKINIVVFASGGAAIVPTITETKR